VNGGGDGATEVAWTVELGVPGGVTTAVILAAVLAGVVWLGLRGDLRGLTPPRRMALLALRIVTVAAALAVVLQLRWLGARERTEAGRLVVLLDGSGSMGLPAGSGEDTRYERAAALVKRWARETPSDVLRSTAPWSFGAPPARPERWGSLAGDGWSTTDGRSDLGGALAAVARGALGPGVGAVVVVGDGRATGAEALPTGALRRAGIAVHTVAVGEPFPDDAIVDVEADPVAFLHNEARVRARVRLAGGPRRPTEVPLTLRREGEVVAETRVAVGEDGVGETELAFVPRRLGREVYRLSIPWRRDDRVPANNERPFLVRVSREKLRVLHVVGSPSWDERFLRGFFKDDPRVDLVSFFILRTAGDLTLADPSELSLIPFPTEELFTEHLGSFDLVVFQNFDYRPYDMARHLPRIRDYVRRGGGFVMVGGDLSFGAGGYAETPVGDVLPVAIPGNLPPRPGGDPEDLGRDVVGGPFRPRLPAPLHPIVALRASTAATVDAWQGLVPVAGANRLDDLTGADAQALLVHPTARTSSGAPMPVLAVGRPGDGRVMALGTDASYRWGFEMAGRSGDASAYERFWDRAVRWLTGDPALEPSTITTDGIRHPPGDRLSVTGRFRDRRTYAPRVARPVAVRLVTEDGAPVGGRVVTTDGGGRIELTLDGPALPGVYRVEAWPADGTEDADDGDRGDGGDDGDEGGSAGVPDLEGSPLAQEPFLVEAAGDEWGEPAPDPDRLARLAEETGGRFAPDVDDAPDLEDVDTTRTTRLGVALVAPLARPWVVLALIGMLLGEWALRRRWGRR